MSMLSEVVQVSPEDRPCVDFESSLDVDSVVSGYIPVKSTIDVFAFLSESAGMHSPRGRGVICWGAYGSGKSRLAAVLARLFRDGFDCPALSPVWERFRARGLISSVDTLRLSLAQGRNTWRPWLVVPIYAGGGGGSLSSCLVRALTKSLRRAGVPQDVLRTSIFQEAAKKLREMVSDKPFVPRTGSPHQTAEMLIRALEVDLDDAALAEFEEFHQKATGYDFRTIVQAVNGIAMDADAVYNEVAQNIQQHGYDGILVLWDELGFAVEQLLSEAKAGRRNLGQEAISLQNFLQRSCGTHELGKRVVFMGFTHVSLKEYGTRANLGTQDQNRLDTVADRFRDPSINIRLSVTEMEGYHLVAGMMHRTPQGQELFRHPVPKLQQIANLMPRMHQNWEPLEVQQCYNEIAAACYPLHPSTVMVLLLLSSQIAQENRTTFYYLQDRQEGGLAGALEQRSLPSRQETGGEELVRITDLYRFFEQALRSRDPRACDQYEDALQRLPDPSPLEVAVLRTVLVLRVAKVPSATRFISFCLADCRPSEPQAKAVTDAISRLAEAGALWQHPATTVLDFIGGGSGVRSEAEAEIEDEEALIPESPGTLLFRRSPEIHAELADFIGDFDLDPAPSGIVRQVTVKVLDMAAGSGAMEDVNPAVGGSDIPWRSAIIYLVVPETSGELRHWREKAEQCHEPNVFFVLPQEPVKLSAKVRKFLAVSRVLGRKDRNEHAYKVLEGHFTKLRQDLRKEIGETFGGAGLRTGTEVIRGGPTPETVSVESWSDLLPGIARSMAAAFSKELRVRCTKFNEWLARREAWTAVEHICEQVLILADEPSCADPYLGFNETSLEAAVIDGVLLENGVLKRDALTDTWVFAPLDELPEPFREAAKHIQSAASGEKEFLRLYARLIEPPYGVPNGVIPLILATVVRTDMSRVAVYRRGSGGQPTRITSRLHEALVEMSKDPARYSTRYEKLSGKQRCIFKALGPEVNVPFNSRDERGEAFYDYSGRVRGAMMAWAGTVPEEAVLGPQASDCEKRLFKLLRAAVPPQASALADALLDVIAEDSATHQEIGTADADTREFPATVQRWRTLCEQVHRRISGVKASVDRAIVEFVQAGSSNPRSDLIEALRNVEAVAPGCEDRVQAITSQLADGPSTSDVAVDVTAAVVRKDPHKLTAEDFGVAAGMLEMARLIEKSPKVRAVVLGSGERIELPNAEIPGLPDRVGQDIARWREEFGAADEAMAAAVVRELFERAGGESAAMPGGPGGGAHSPAEDAVAGVEAAPEGQAAEMPTEVGRGQQ